MRGLERQSRTLVVCSQLINRSDILPLVSDWERDRLVPANKRAKFSECLLLVADRSPETERALQYVGRIVGRRQITVHVLYLLNSLPPELLEFGGSEDPLKEEKLESQLRREQKQWIAAAHEAANPILDHAAQVLRRAGVPKSRIHFHFSDPTDASRAVDAVLREVKSTRCHTVVLGHATHSWFRELTGGHLAEQLVRHAKGLTMWVVQ